ncbi:MAG: hypothetical protein ACR2QI_02280 [Woeseiaceae bacterium]
MKNEQENVGKDQLVTDIYKELASEQTPDRLNERVLLLARSNGRTRYSAIRAWTRPVAWAATIGLSLALVLELTRLPPIAPPEELEEPADSVSADEFVPHGISVLREAENMARAQTGSDQAPTTARTEVGELSADEISVEDVSAAASFAEVAETKLLESGGTCPEKTRETAESWFNCIEQLREAGLQDNADDEFREFRKIFPDFAQAKTDK